MTAYSVQYTLPVDNPEKNVCITVVKPGKKSGNGHKTFLVPMNYPNAHNLSYMDLCAAVDLSGLFTLPTDPNRDLDRFIKEHPIKKDQKVKPLRFGAGDSKQPLPP